MNSKTNISAVHTETDQSIINDGILGAELCDGCHSQNDPSGTTVDHTTANTHRELGLSGDSTNSHNMPPDLEAGAASSEGNSTNIGPYGEGGYDLSNPEDCGFCHV